MPVNKSYISLAPLISWRHHPHPLDWGGLFGGPCPLEMEIGFGTGERLVRRAGEEPGLCLVGVEVSWPAVRRGLRKVALAGVDNVRILQGNSRAVLARLFPSQSLERVVALFPCPWPAERHAHRRLFSRPELRVLNNRLVMGGEVQMVTDQAWYHAWVVEQAQGAGFQIKARRRGAGLETKYERKWRRAGQEKFHELVLVKQEHLPPPENKEAVVESLDLSRFQPEAIVERDFPGKVAIAFRELVHDAPRGKALLRAVVNEDDYVQAFWLEFASKDGAWVVRPALGCGVLPTKGVRQAMELARQMAQGDL